MKRTTKNHLVHNTGWLKCYSHAIFDKDGLSSIVLVSFVVTAFNLNYCIELCERCTLSYSSESYRLNRTPSTG